MFVADLTNNPIAQTEESFSELAKWGFNLIGTNLGTIEEIDPYTSKPTIIICNKADIPGALDEFGVMEDKYGSRYPVIMFSAEENVGGDELGTEIFQALNIMRVYPKSPRERLQDFRKQDPIVLSVGSTVGEAAHEVHKDLSRSLKFAILWGDSGKFEGQRVGRNHELRDGDVIEIHS